MILWGAKELLKNKTLQSILLELDETRGDYESSKNLIQKSGFKLVEKTNPAKFEPRAFSAYNHIFKR